MYIPAWPPRPGNQRQNLHAQCACGLSSQNEFAQAKVKTNFPCVLKQKITRNFLNLKNKMAFEYYLGGIPTENELDRHERHYFMLYKTFWG